MTHDWHTTLEGREALSLRYATTVIPVLQLSTGRYAIFNHTWELCGITDSLNEWPPLCWFPAAIRQQDVEGTIIDLHNLGLL